MSSLKLKQIALVAVTVFCLPQLVTAQDNAIAAGIEHFKAERFDEAEKYFSGFIEKHPNHALALHYLSRVEFKKLAMLRPTEQMLSKHNITNSYDAASFKNLNGKHQMNFTIGLE